MPADLPYLDTHTVAVAAGSDQAYASVRRFAGRLGFGPHNPLALVLGTRPRRGFAIVEEVAGQRVGLEGRHRFATYRLVLEVEPRPEQRTTLLHAHSYASFPGAAGRVYRALVIGTGLHVLATRGLLRAASRA
ncbi:MAG: hypothetical protein ACJ72E_10915 [Marmoricola sp.]